MQILTFTVAGQPYAIPSRTVLEVLPLVPARPLPLLPPFLPGVFTYRGHLVPLVDLARRFGAPAADPAVRRLSTRVIVVEFPLPTPPERAEAADSPRRARLGLVADNVISIQTVPDDQAGSTSSDGERAPFLGRLLRLDGRTVQMVAVERLLPHDLLTDLVATVAGASGP
ncbi:MAG: chemotaxis protein CheW [Planctomycetia bacterium]